MSNGQDFEDDFPEMDVADVDPSKVGSHIAVDKPGRYHFGISEVRARLERTTDRGNQRRPDILVVCEVLEGVPGQSGKGALYFHSMPIAGKGGTAAEGWVMESLSNFLCGIGVLVKKDGQIIDPATNSTRIDMRSLCDRIAAAKQFVGDIKCNKSDDPQYPDKYELTFGRGAFQVDADEVAGVPKNVAALKLIGKESAAAPAGGAGTNGNGKSAAKGTGKKKEEPEVAGAAATVGASAVTASAAAGGLDTSDL